MLALHRGKDWNPHLQLCLGVSWIMSALYYLSDCLAFLWDFVWEEEWYTDFFCSSDVCQDIGHCERWQQTPATSPEAEPVPPVPARYSSWAGTNVHKAVRPLPANGTEARTKTFLCVSQMSPGGWYSRGISSTASQLHCGRGCPITLSTAGRVLLRSVQTRQAESAVAALEKRCTSLSAKQAPFMVPLRLLANQMF